MDFRTKANTYDDLSLHVGDNSRSPSFELRATVAQPSAAWLLAQRAFAMPEHPQEQAFPAVVVVRKGRGAGRHVASGQADMSQGRATAPSLPAVKSPRVFRVGQLANDTAIGDDNEPLPAVAETAPANAFRSKRFRRHRFDADKQPGPVLQVFQAPLAEGFVIATPRVDAGLSKTESAALLNLLANVNRSIQDAVQADAFDLEPASLHWREFLADIERMKLQLQRMQQL